MAKHKDIKDGERERGQSEPVDARASRPHKSHRRRSMEDPSKLAISAPKPKRPEAPPAKSALAKSKKKDPQPGEYLRGPGSDSDTEAGTARKRTGSNASLDTRSDVSSSAESDKKSPKSRVNPPKMSKKSRRVAFSSKAPAAQDAPHSLAEWDKKWMWQSGKGGQEIWNIHKSEVAKKEGEEMASALAYRAMPASERWKQDISDVREYAREVSNRINNGFGAANTPASQDYMYAYQDPGSRSKQIQIGTQVRATSLRIRHEDRPVASILQDMDKLEKSLKKKPKEYFKSPEWEKKNKDLRTTRLILQRQIRGTVNDEKMDRFEGHGNATPSGWRPSLPLMDDDDDEFSMSEMSSGEEEAAPMASGSGSGRKK